MIVLHMNPTKMNGNCSSLIESRIKGKDETHFCVYNGIRKNDLLPEV
jgi:hypothetical protein